jgi:archaemetzincin
MLLIVERGLPQDALRVLGITAVDLYVPQLNFVFGEARLGGPSAVISTHRLRPEFYGQLPDEKLFLRRVEIEAVHELGHTFGLGHCPKVCCVMHFSNNIADTDRKGPLFCDDCRHYITGAVQKQTAGLV